MRVRGRGDGVVGLSADCGGDGRRWEDEEEEEEEEERDCGGED